MIRNSRLTPVLVSLTALFAVLAVAAHPADAQEKPFKVTGGGIAPKGLSLFGLDSPHNATGTATHLGKYTGNEGNANVLSFDPPSLSGTFHGSFVFVAANGDRLACDYGGPGTFGVISATPAGVVVQFIAVFTPNPGDSTGQFASVIGGSFLMIATTSPFPLQLTNGFTPPFAYTWEGEGSLIFGKGK